MQKFNVLIIIFVVLLAGFIATVAITKNLPKRNGTNSFKTEEENLEKTQSTKLGEISASTKPTVQNVSDATKPPEGYVKVSDSELKTLSKNTKQYSFLKGQPNREGADVHNNYSVIIPNSWKVYTYTNDQNRDDYGTNLLLLKGTDSILISQQLLDSGVCFFDETDTSNLDMGVLCSLKDTLYHTTENLKVYLPHEQSNSASSFTFKVCDQDSYAQDIAKYKTPSERDKRACSPWTKFGEISYTTATKNNNYDDFVKIIESLSVIR